MVLSQSLLEGLGLGAAVSVAEARSQRESGIDDSTFRAHRWTVAMDRAGAVNGDVTGPGGLVRVGKVEATVQVGIDIGPERSGHHTDQPVLRPKVKMCGEPGIE